MGLDMRQMAAAALDAAFEDSSPEEQREHKGRTAIRGIAAGLVLGGAARIAIKRASTVRQLGGALKIANRLREAPERMRETISDGVADLRERMADFDHGGTEPDADGRQAEQPEGAGAEQPEGEEPEAPADQEPEEAEAEEPEEAEAEEPGEAEAEEPEEAEAEAPEEAEEPEEAEAEAREESEAEGGAGSGRGEGAGDERDRSPDSEPGGAEIVDALVGEQRDNPGHGRSETPDVLSLLTAPRESPPIVERLGGERRASPTSRPPVTPESGSRRRSRERQSRKRAGAR